MLRQHVHARRLLRRELLGERDERVELGGGGAGVDRLLGELHALGERLGAAAGVDRGAGVEHREVTGGARLAGEDRARDVGVLLGSPPGTASAGWRASPNSSGITGVLLELGRPATSITRVAAPRC